jgi:hypothetical protein
MPSQSTVLEVSTGPCVCTVTQTIVPTPEGNPADIAYVSAGTIAVTGGATPFLMTPEVDTLSDGRVEASYRVARGLFIPGEPLRVTASGATAPPFSADIVVPNPITITQPNITQPEPTSPLAVVRRMDLRIAWSGGGPSGIIDFGIAQSVGATITEIRCMTPASAGSAVIPASALSYLTPTHEGSPPFGTSASILVTSIEEQTIGDWDIRVLGQPQEPLDLTVTVDE